MSRKLNDLSIFDQQEMLICYDNGELKNLCETRAARILNVTPKTMRTVLGNRDSIQKYFDGNDFLRITNNRRKDLLDDLNNILFQCFVEISNLDLPLDDDILLNRAQSITSNLEIPNFVPDMLWIKCWKKSRKIPDESTYKRTVDSIVSEKRKWLESLIEYALTAYRPDDIYTLIETGVHYVEKRADLTFIPTYTPEKYHVQTISAVYMCNITGTVKRTPLVMENVHDFSGINPMPDNYHINFHMLKSKDFKLYIKQLDREIAPRRILIILDGHSEYTRIQLKHVEVRSMSKGTIHPLGQKIMDVSKTYVFQNVTPQMIASAENVRNHWETVASIYKQSFLYAWDFVTPMTIRNCFRTFHFLSTDAENESDVRFDSSSNDLSVVKNQQRQTVITHSSCVQNPQNENDRNDKPLNLCKSNHNSNNNNNLTLAYSPNNTGNRAGSAYRACTLQQCIQNTW